MADKQEIGRLGEEEAARLLKKHGYRVVEKNYRCRYGEIDIIAKDGETLAFVEVKTRGSDLFGTPKCGVDAKKQRHMISASSVYLNEKGLDDADVRFDVVSIMIKDGKYITELIKDAFGAEDTI